MESQKDNTKSEVGLSGSSLIILERTGQIYNYQILPTKLDLAMINIINQITLVTKWCEVAQLVILRSTECPSFLPVIYKHLHPNCV